MFPAEDGNARNHFMRRAAGIRDLLLLLPGLLQVVDHHGDEEVDHDEDHHDDETGEENPRPAVLRTSCPV